MRFFLELFLLLCELLSPQNENFACHQIVECHRCFFLQLSLWSKTLILKLFFNSFHFLFLYSGGLLAGLFWGRVVGCQKCFEESDIWLPYCHRNMICEMRMSHWIRPWNHVSGPYQEKIDSDKNPRKTRRALFKILCKIWQISGRWIFVTSFVFARNQHFQALRNNWTFATGWVFLKLMLLKNDRIETLYREKVLRLAFTTDGFISEDFYS